MNQRQLAAEKQNRIHQAMFALKDNEHFRTFMSLLEDMKNDAAEYAADHDSAKDARVCLSANMEVRAYLNIIRAYKSYIAAGEQQLEEQAARQELEQQELAGQ